jgi:translation initiation factor IF-3
MPKVRLVGEGVNEVITGFDALGRAEAAGLDLVVVSTASDVPVVRIQDYKKLLYEAKKAKSKQTKGSETKEIQLKVNISDHDLTTTKIAAIQRFLERGDKVKVTIRLKGRERENPGRARELLSKVLAAVECKSTRMAGPITMVLLEPK